MQPQSATLSSLTEREQERDIRQLFYRLAACFGAQWENQFVGDAKAAQVIKAEWRYRLRHTPRHRISTGLERLESRPAKSRRFVPGAIEFADLCKPTAQELGIPAIWPAYEDAMRGTYTHPVPAVVAVSIGRSWLASRPASITQKVWRERYEDALDRACNGEPFDWPAGTNPDEPLLTAQKPVPASTQTARRCLDALRGRTQGEATHEH